MEELFESSVRSAGDIGAAFEFDGECAYFYLLDLKKDSGEQVVAAVEVREFSYFAMESSLQIRWSRDERFVLLTASKKVIAAFDSLTLAAFSGSGGVSLLSDDFKQAVSNAFLGD